jgi:hypothetical protein
MDFNNISERLNRLYSSLGEIRDTNWQSKVNWGPGDGPDISFGSQDVHENEQKIFNVIHGIANFKDNLKNKLSSLALSPKLVETEIDNSIYLQLIADLSNQDKHGYPLTKTRRSGKDPLLANVQSALRIQEIEIGSIMLAVNFETGVLSIPGSQGTIIINGDIVDGNSTLVCDIDSMLDNAIMTWETFIAKHRLT